MIRLGLDLRLPTQAVVEGQVRAGLPAVLEEQRQLVLNDRLGARLVHRQSADAGLLEVERHRAGDVRAHRAGAVFCWCWTC